MRIYYRGPDCLVTSKFFVWRTAPARFAIRDLRDVCIAHRELGRPVPIGTCLAGGACLATTAAAALWHSPALCAFAVLSGTVAVSLAALSLRSRPTLLELRATWYGREVVLYTATDERVFNQVSRALRRAIEDESWDDVEAA